MRAVMLGRRLLSVESACTNEVMVLLQKDGIETGASQILCRKEQPATIVT